jgi:hypothetical protein
MDEQTTPRKVQLREDEYVFVKEYCKDLNPIGAVERGFSHVPELQVFETAADYINRPSVQEAIAIRLANGNKNGPKMIITPSDLGITEGYVLVRLKDIADFCNVTAQTKADLVQPQVRVKALELMGKHIGMFNDNKDGTAAQSFNVFDDNTRQELLDRIARNVKQHHADR